MFQLIHNIQLKANDIFTRDSKVNIVLNNNNNPIGSFIFFDNNNNGHRHRDHIDPNNNIMSMIYTSDSTGKPKGV